MADKTRRTEESAKDLRVYKLRRESLPITKNEDVEFSCEQADADDLEAVDRAEAADQRQQSNL